MAGGEYTRRSATDRPGGRRGRRTGPAAVVVGAASRDVTAADRRGWRLGGGVTYCALTLARLGIATAALVGVDQAAAKAWELDLLRGAGADVRLVHLEHGPVFENVERSDGRVQTCVDAGSAVPVDALPAAWRPADWWVLGPVAGELPDAWAAVPPSAAHVVLGWQGLLRDLRPGGHVGRLAPRASPLVARAELVAVSRHDVDQALPIPALIGPLRAGAELILTAGDAGGFVLRAGPGGRAARVRRYPALRSAHEVDPTGAGDTFLAAYVAGRIAATRAARPVDERRLLRLAAAAAALVVEDVGLVGVPDGERLACRLRGQG
jgi:sugar/nucleoside kinase (ribokinase family)